MRILPPAAVPFEPAPGSLIVDHTCTEIEGIPGFWTDLVRSLIDGHCAHTSRTLPMDPGPGGGVFGPCGGGLRKHRIPLRAPEQQVKRPDHTEKVQPRH